MTSVAVVGDIFYDYVCDLSSSASQIPPELVRRNVDIVADVSGVVGGGGMQFGVAAANAGLGPVTVIGKVGRAGAELDIEAAAACNAMHAAGINTCVAFDDTTRTGRAMITYFPGDLRFMVSDPGANATLEPADLTPAMLTAAATARLLYVSGYSLVQPARRAAVRQLIDGARTSGATIALDVVPHDFDSFMPRSAVDELLESVDWILLAASTGRRLVNASEDATVDDVLTTLLERTPSVGIFHHPSAATIAHASLRHERTYAYAPGAGSRGQSARAHAVLLHEFVGGRIGAHRV